MMNGSTQSCAASPGSLSAAVSPQNIHPQGTVHLSVPLPTARCPAGRRPPPPSPLLPSPQARLALTLTRCCRAGFRAAIRLSWATASKMEGRSSPAEAAVRWAPTSAMAPVALLPAARGSSRTAPAPAGHPPGAAEHRPPEVRRSVSSRRTSMVAGARPL